MEENNTPDLTNEDNYIYHDDSAGYLEEDENVPTSAQVPYGYSMYLP